MAEETSKQQAENGEEKCESTFQFSFFSFLSNLWNDFIITKYLQVLWWCDFYKYAININLICSSFI